MLAVVLAAAVAACAGAGAAAPSNGPETYRDALSGLRVRRMTTDGRDAGAINQQGDMSGEASAFSPDSRSIVFAKCCGRAGGSPGIYVQAVDGGRARPLARTAVWSPYPVFSRDGTEVYFYDRAGSVTVVSAVAVASGRVRRLAAFPGTEWQEKIEVNADGSLLAVHVRVQGVYHTHVLRPDGTPLASWDPSAPSGDGGFWNPVHPERLMARRGRVARAWNVHDLSDATWAWSCEGCDVAHAAWHPNGEWYFAGGYTVNARTGERLGGTGINPIHPSFHPGHADRGLQARLTADEAPWFFEGRGRPRLYTPTLRQAMSGDFRHTPVALHYSSYANNHAHPHPHWSPDGRFIFFASDGRSDRDGPAPGGGGGVDIYLVESPVVAAGAASERAR